MKRLRLVAIFLAFLLIVTAWADTEQSAPDPAQSAPDLTLTIEKLFGTYTYWRNTDEFYECGYIDFALDHTWTWVAHYDDDRDRHTDRYQVTRGTYAVGRQENNQFGFWCESDGIEQTYLNNIKVINGRVRSFTFFERSFKRREGDMPFFVLAHDTPLVAGKLRITSDPPGAAVLVNGYQMPGTTPMVLESLEAGVPLTVRVVLPDYRAREQPITLVENQDASLSFKLFKGDASIRIESTPRVKVKLDGEWVGVTPISLQELAAGPHTLEFVNQALGINQREEIEIESGEVFYQHYRFSGRLLIDVGRTCEIYRRGKHAGDTPFDQQVPVGRHVLTLVDSNGERRRLVVDVLHNKTTRIDQLFETLPEVE